MLLICMIPAPSWAQSEGALPRRKVALIIGNASYVSGRADGGAATLDTPVADATAIEAKLKAMDFTTTLLINGKNNLMREQIATFTESLRPDDLVVVYYAGHGLELGGETYLIAIDAKINTEASVKLVGIPLSSLVPESSQRVFGLWIILDTCRENPFSTRAKGASQPSGGLPAGAPDSTLIFFATSPGETASDGQGLKPEHGIFTTALLDALDVDPPTVASVITRTVRKVREATGGEQSPRRNGQFLDESFDLRRVAGGSVSAPVQTASASQVAYAPPVQPAATPKVPDATPSVAAILASARDLPTQASTPVPTPAQAPPPTAAPTSTATADAGLPGAQPYRPDPQPQQVPKPLAAGDGAAPMQAPSTLPTPDLSRPRMPALVMPVVPPAFCTYLDYIDYLNTYYKQMTLQADANYRTARDHQDRMHRLFEKYRDQAPGAPSLKAVDVEMRLYDRITDQYFQFSTSVVHLSTPLSQVPQDTRAGCIKPPWPAIAVGQSTSVTPVE